MVTYDAFPGECLSSWAYRMALWRKDFPMTPDTVNLLYYQSFLSSTLDPDYDPQSDFAKVCYKALRTIRADEELESFLTPATRFVMPRYFRRSYCFGCFCDQLKKAWSPAALKQWGLIYYCVCDVHQVSLFDANFHVIKKANAAHDFFYFHTEQRIGSSISSYSNEAHRVTLEVQRFMRGIEGGSEVLSVNASILEFCCLFLEILLFPRFGICNTPNASKGVAVQTPVWQQSHLGPFLATVLERQSALLLLGWVLEVPGATVQFLPKRFGSVIAHEDQNLWWLGVASSYLPDKYFRHSALRLSYLSKSIDLPGVKDFISGFISRLGR